MYARVAYYQFKPGGGREVVRRAEQGMLPIFRRHDGFRSYTTILTENDTGFSISMWDSEQQAADATQAASDWVRQNVANLIESVQNHVGEVGFTQSA